MLGREACLSVNFGGFVCGVSASVDNVVNILITIIMINLMSMKVAISLVDTMNMMFT